MSFRPLTPKQEIFVDYYLGEARFNAAEAARLAGYIETRKAGWRNRRHPLIQARIAERLKEVALEADEVLAILSDQARASLRPFLKEARGGLVPDLCSEEAKANLHLLKKAKFKQRPIRGDEESGVETEVELELHDVQNALVQIGRHLGLFKEQRDDLLKTIDLSKLTDEQLQRLSNGENILSVLIGSK